MTTLDFPPVPEVPFRGIESFRFIDQQIFAERDDEVWDLQSKVTRFRAVLLYGESGTGKSSLINAGFIPAVIKKNLIVNRIRVQPIAGQEMRIEQISITSDGQPPYLPSSFVTDEPSSSLVLSVEDFVARLEKTKKVAEPPQASLEERDFEFTPRERPLLIFDQFEEFITLFEPSGSAAQQASEASQSSPQQIKEALVSRKEAQEKAKEAQRKILDALVRLIQDESLRIKLLFVFREDYLAKLNILFQRTPDLLDQYLRLLPPGIEVVTRIIRAPFERLPGVFVNRPPEGLGTEISTALADEIKTKFSERSQGGPLNLSELEIVCRRLWESKNPESLFSQKQIGGVLEDYFSEKLGAFPDELREPAIALLSLMITADNTRNIISEADLFSRVEKEEKISDSVKAEKARDLLLGTRLVWRELRNGVYFYTIASDYLASWIAKKKLERISDRERQKLVQEAEVIKLTQQDEQISSVPTAVEHQNRGFDERAFIARLKAAGPEELAQLVRHPSHEEEICLRAYFGDERYQELHALALKSKAAGRAPKGNVVVIHGLMGSELGIVASGSQSKSGDVIWLNSFRIMSGRLSMLKLNEDGRSGEYNIRSTGIMKRYYGELILALSEKWNVQAFWFDWRKDINLAAAELETQITSWFGDDQPVHIVAHDMGGLVARAFIKKYPRRWQGLWDRQSGMTGRRGGRLIMLGTPNHGTFAIPQMITGIDPLIRKLSLLDIRHDTAEVLQIFNSFPGLYQMLPSPMVVPEADRLYQSDTYGELNVPQNCLDLAHKTHVSLKDVVDTERMIYITGQNRPTICGIKDYQKLSSVESYEVTLDGDGRVPHSLGLLRTSDGMPVKSYYVEEEHGNLSSNSKIIAALNGLLETGQTAELNDLVIAGAKLSAGGTRASDSRLALAEADDEADLLLIARRVRSSTSDSAQSLSLSADERKIEEFLSRGYMGESVEESKSIARMPTREVPTIEIGLVHGAIESIPYGKIRSKEGLGIDALAVGHYIGVLPQGPELSLDRALSGIKTSKAARARDLSKGELLLTQYTEWGIIHGELGRPFFIDDTRKASRSGSSRSGARLVAIAGMGMPGRFGAPQLTLLAHNLCWSLARIGKRHLATVLIGAGTGNLPLSDAVSGWISGIKRALENSADRRHRLQRVTFVEYDPRKIRSLQEAIVNELRHLTEMERPRINIEYKELSESVLSKINESAMVWERRELKKGLADSDKLTSQIPTRLLFEMEGPLFRYGAISETESTPERLSAIDPSLVQATNDELAGEQNPGLLVERGRFMGQLLIPSELDRQLADNAPLVLLLDDNTSRIHWELVSPPNAGTPTARGKRNRKEVSAFPYEDAFLGTSRGLTRQFTDMYSMLPEPPPPPRRTLRVLVVADPAEDARLPGAEIEGIEVANVFESFNSVYETGLGENRVEVIKLLGPVEATRTSVLRELMVHHYDVLYFSGYCVYRWDGDPSRSGWVFNAGKKEILSADELTRIDRIPRFVFSNANETGITPDRARERSGDLASSFARMFFARGVSNFVCPAWPLDDLPARLFAQTLFAALLGLEPKEEGGGYKPASPQPMNIAMREARLRLAVNHGNPSDWGAFQHYGNPYFQFFAQ